MPTRIKELESYHTKGGRGGYRGNGSRPYISMVYENSSLAKVKGRKVNTVYPLVIGYYQWCRLRDDTA